jgi:hypothetical protein
VISTRSTRPRRTRTITNQSQPQHATTAQTDSPTRPDTKHRNAHLGITIRRDKNQDKTGTWPWGTAGLIVDLERTV